MKHLSMSSKAKSRRLRVISRLEEQLSKRTKTVQQSHVGSTNIIIEEHQISLNESDVKRIKKEIETLKTRV